MKYYTKYCQTSLPKLRTHQNLSKKLESIKPELYFETKSRIMSGSKECEYVFKKGNRKGEQCQRKAKNVLNLCGDHTHDAMMRKRAHQTNRIERLKSFPEEYEKYLADCRERNEILREKMGKGEYNKKMREYQRISRKGGKQESEMKRCVHIFKHEKRRGEQCHRKTKGKLGLCCAHNPESAKKARERMARRKKTIDERLEKEAADFFENDLKTNK